MKTQVRKSLHGQWSSKLIFVISATGAAVGLGNIWKFPYEVAANGGSAFVLAYIICLFILGIPLLTAEMAIGKLGRANPIKSIKILAEENNKSTVWSALGWLNIATLIMVLSFYSVVAGWAVKYFCISCVGAFDNINTENINLIWENTINNPLEIISFHALFMIITVAVVACGVNKGIETANKILMPLLFLLLISLVIYSINSPGFTEGWQFMFGFRYEDINITTLLKAFGQTCFTLAIGAGCMLVYGSYVSENTNLGQTSVMIAIINLLVAILIGLAIFPLIFSYNLKPIGGPGLIFQTIPVAFGNMPYGRIFGSLFFALIVFAAWTSSISMAEPIIIMLIEKFNIKRSRSALLTGITTWVIGILSALSFNVLDSYYVLGYPNFFTAITEITTNYMLPVGILGFAIFVGWQMNKESIKECLKFESDIMFNAWYFIVRYLSPIIVILIIL